MTDTLTEKDHYVYLATYHIAKKLKNYEINVFKRETYKFLNSNKIVLWVWKKEHYLFDIFKGWKRTLNYYKTKKK